VTTPAPAADPVPSLDCREVRAGYGSVTIVPSFDLTALAGTVVALLGPNGAGKTTLLLTLAGLIPRQEGWIGIEGEVLKSGRPAAAARAGLVLVPDDRALFTSLTVEQNLAVARGRHKTTVDGALDRFPVLAQRRGVTAGNLSGGEQQMLAMARALMQEPKILLIDEMSMGLAPVIVEELLPMVRSIADDTGSVVVLVEQHVALALEVADRAMVLVHGEIALDRPAQELRENPDLLEAVYFGEHPRPTGAT
jgi:branched-chain amino acid transport system ATP-binding protein